MDTTSNSENPLVELIQLFGKDGLAHKDINDLKTALDTLTATLEKRAGKPEEDPNASPKTLLGNIKDFGKGFASPITKDLPKFLGFGKSSLPENINKVATEEPPETIEPTEPILQTPNETSVVENKFGDMGNVIPREDLVQDTPKEISPSVTVPPSVSSESTNKVLSDMVEVLIDLKDDKTQKQILEEAINIKKIIANNMVSSSDKAKGIEPNSESAKNEDREKLAEAIADKLSDVLSAAGGGGGIGIDIPGSSGGKGSGGKSSGGKPGSPSRIGPSVAAIGRTAVAGAAVTGAVSGLDYVAGEFGVGKDEKGNDLKIDESQDDKNWEKMSTGQQVISGVGRGIEKVGDLLPFNALSNTVRQAKYDRINAETAGLKQDSEKDKLELPSPDEAKYILQKGTTEEIKNWGGEEKLKGIIKQSETIQPSNKTLKFPNQPTELVSPKESPALKNVLENVTGTNTDLKLSPQTTQTNTIAPFVSNKVVNNTEQTIIGTPPSPHSSFSSFNRWQDKRSTYTDR